MSRVFMVEKPKYDVTAAAAYGELTLLYTSRYPVFHPGFCHYDVLKNLDRHEFDPASDYLMVVGHMAILTITVAKLVERYGRVRLLAFDAHGNQYHCIDTGDEHAGEGLGDTRRSSALPRVPVARSAAENQRDEEDGRL